MASRQLISDDGTFAVYAHFDDAGNVTGQVREPSPSYVPPPEVSNSSSLEERLLAALSTNAAFLALDTPTNAQTVAQVRALTRECSALIRVIYGMTNEIPDT